MTKLQDGVWKPLGDEGYDAGDVMKWLIVLSKGTLLLLFVIIELGKYLVMSRSLGCIGLHKTLNSFTFKLHLVVIPILGDFIEQITDKSGIMTKYVYYYVSF